MSDFYICRSLSFLPPQMVQYTDTNACNLFLILTISILMKAKAEKKSVREKSHCNVSNTQNSSYNAFYKMKLCLNCRVLQQSRRQSFGQMVQSSPKVMTHLCSFFSSERYERYFQPPDSIWLLYACQGHAVIPNKQVSFGGKTVTVDPQRTHLSIRWACRARGYKEWRTYYVRLLLIGKLHCIMGPALNWTACRTLEASAMFVSVFQLEYD